MAAVDVVEQAGEIALAVLPVAFIVQYSILAHWWRYPVGRVLVAWNAVIVLSAVPLAADWLFIGSAIRRHPGLIWIHVACVYAALAIVCCQIWILERLRRRDPLGLGQPRNPQ
jgi:hypothetical protein